MKTENTPLQRSVRDLLLPAFELCEEAPEIIGHFCGTFEREAQRHGIARFMVAPSYWSKRVPRERIGIIAGLDGRDEIAPRVLLGMIDDFSREVEPPFNLLPVVYPLANPAGFEAATKSPPGGADLTAENWASSTEPEIRILEREIRSCHFHGLILMQETDAEVPSVRLHHSTIQFQRVLCALGAAAGVTPQRVIFWGTLEDHGACGVFADLPEAPWLVALQIPRKALHDAELAHDAQCFLESFLGFYARRQGQLPPGAGSVLNPAPRPSARVLLAQA